MSSEAAKMDPDAALEGLLTKMGDRLKQSSTSIGDLMRQLKKPGAGQLPGIKKLQEALSQLPKKDTEKTVLLAWDKRYKDLINPKPIHVAVLSRNLKMVELLLDSGQALCSAFAQSKTYGKKMTPLHLACLIGDVDIIRCLLERGADPNRCTAGPKRLSPLHMAVIGGSVDAVRQLLQTEDAQFDAEGDPNCVLMMAWRLRRTEIWKLLLDFLLANDDALYALKSGCFLLAEAILEPNPDKASIQQLFVTTLNFIYVQWPGRESKPMPSIALNVKEKLSELQKLFHNRDIDVTLTNDDIVVDQVSPGEKLLELAFELYCVLLSDQDAADRPVWATMKLVNIISALVAEQKEQNKRLKLVLMTSYFNALEPCHHYPVVIQLLEQGVKILFEIRPATRGDPDFDALVFKLLNVISEKIAHCMHTIADIQEGLIKADEVDFQRHFLNLRHVFLDVLSLIAKSALTRMSEHLFFSVPKADLRDPVNGEALLHLLAKRNRHTGTDQDIYHVFQLLICNIGCFMGQNSMSETPLISFVKHNTVWTSEHSEDILKLMISSGINTDAKDHHNKTVFDYVRGTSLEETVLSACNKNRPVTASVASLQKEEDVTKEQKEI